MEEFYQGGQLDSSGEFTVDYDRLVPTLAKHQFRSAHQVPLRLLAAAVEGGATWFEVQGNRFTWDTVHPLRAVNELTIALQAASVMKAQVRAESGTESLDLRGGQAAHGGCSRPGTSVELRWAGWWPRRVRLGAEGHWAPLDLRGVSLRRPSPRVRLGSPPLPLDCPREVPEGCGYVFVDTPLQQVLLVVHGVAYPGPSLAKGLGAVWWDDTLALDLSREKLVEDPHLARVLEDVLNCVAQAVAPERSCRDWLMREAPRVPDTPLFPHHDGQLRSYQQLVAEFEEKGYLTVGSPALVNHPLLPRLFPLILPVNVGPSLPEGDYLARVPMRGRRGELGLRRDLHGLRYHADGKVEEHPDHLYRGVDMATLDFAEFSGLPDLYRALVYQRRPAGDEEILRAHYLQAWRMTSEFADGDWKGKPHRWSAEDLRELGRRFHFPLYHGGTVTLDELRGTSRYRVESADPTGLTPPLETVVLPLDEMVNFTELMGLREFYEETTWTDPARMFANSQLAARDPLRSLALLPDSTSSRVLRKLLGELPAEQVSCPPDLFDRAWAVATRQWSAMLGTDHLLWALLEDRPLAGAHAALAAARGREQAQTAHSRMGGEYLPVWRHRYASALMDQGRPREAYQQLQGALQHPWDRAGTQLRLGFNCRLLGNFPEALEWYRRARPQLPGSWEAATWAGEGEALLHLEDDVAADACLHRALELDATAYTQSLLARLALRQDRPDEALDWVEQVLTGDDLRFSSIVFETQSLALLRQGRSEEARAARERFLEESRLHGLPEPDAAERLAAAREQL